MTQMTYTTFSFGGRSYRSAIGACLALWLGAAAAQPQGAPAQRLRIVGGLAGLNVFVNHEEPFWTRELARLSGGRFGAEIVPFDRAGIRSQEVLTLLRLGVVPFATVQASSAGVKDAEILAVDLAGLNPDMKTLRRTVAAIRPHMETMLRERHGIEALALYVYPAQVLFCKEALSGLDGLKGRRVRTSGPTQADWVEALGGQPVTTSFVDILPNLRGGSIDCAITGTMSGNTIGLHELTTHIHPMAITWGLSIFAANSAAWAALPPDLQVLLRRELPRLEQAVWDEAERETEDGFACSVGAATCRKGRRGQMTGLAITPADEQRRRAIFSSTVLPRWLQRCGEGCAAVWNRSIAPVAGVEAKPR
ncbi:MAG: TRAP transporter substrate-binding protein [Pseudomonadota bacterium]